MNVRPCPAAANCVSRAEWLKAPADGCSSPWSVNWELFLRKRDQSIDKEMDKTEIWQVSMALPKGVFCRCVRAIDSVEQVGLCVTLTLVKEKPTVFQKEVWALVVLYLSSHSHIRITTNININILQSNKDIFAFRYREVKKCSIKLRAFSISHHWKSRQMPQWGILPLHPWKTNL